MSLRLVPWASWDEWELVRSSLFSPDTEQRRLGLQRVAIWRCRGRLPLSVDLTGALVEVQLRDSAYTAAQPSDGSSSGAAVPAHASEAELRLLYSMASIRVVNGVTDTSQKGRYALSVASLARRTGLPHVLVEIRHEARASHNELPSLPLLRHGADQALVWLADRYWRRQSASVAVLRGRLRELLLELVHLHSIGYRSGAAEEAQEPAEAIDAYDSAAAQGQQQLAPPTQSASGRRLRRQNIVRDISKDIVPAWDSRALAAELITLQLSPQPAAGAPPQPAAPDMLQGWVMAVRTLSKRWPALPAAVLGALAEAAEAAGRIGGDDGDDGAGAAAEDFSPAAAAAARNVGQLAGTAGELAQIALEAAASGALIPAEPAAPPRRGGQQPSAAAHPGPGSSEHEPPSLSGAGALLRALQRCAAADGPAAAAVAAGVSRQLERLSGDPQAQALARAALAFAEAPPDGTDEDAAADRRDAGPAGAGPGTEQQQQQQQQQQQPRKKRRGGKGRKAAANAQDVTPPLPASSAPATPGYRGAWALAERWVLCPIGASVPGAVFHGDRPRLPALPFKSVTNELFPGDSAGGAAAAGAASGSPQSGKKRKTRDRVDSAAAAAAGGPSDANEQRDAEADAADEDEIFGAEAEEEEVPGEAGRDAEDSAEEEAPLGVHSHGHRSRRSGVAAGGGDGDSDGSDEGEEEEDEVLEEIPLDPEPADGYGYGHAAGGWGDDGGAARGAVGGFGEHSAGGPGGDGGFGGAGLGGAHPPAGGGGGVFLL